ncbi:MAG: hypothetical protein LBL66_09930, partial [Clostridiales bacterium]|nr:hypothetical protein [Clostridiales bacterium]
MKKTAYLKVWLTGLSLLAAAAAMSAAGLWCAPPAGAGYPLVIDLFETDGVRLTANARLPESLRGADSRYGLGFTAAFSGASAEYAHRAAGVFSAEVFPYGGAAAFYLRFTDFNDGGNFFDVAVSSGGSGYGVSVRARNAEAGIRYYTGNWASDALSGTTAASNARSLYTSVSAGAALVLRFDPSDRTVTAEKKGGARYTVWDFGKRMNDGRDIGFTLDGFSSYTVSVVFEGLTGGEGSLLVYSWRGQSLSGSALADNAGPSIYADLSAQGFAGE